MTSVSHVGLQSCHTLKFKLICLDLFLLKQGLHNLSRSRGVKRHEYVDEVTVNRDKPPLLLWEQAWPLTPDLTAEALYGWLSQRRCGPTDHKHSPWAGWTVMDGSPWAGRSGESAPIRSQPADLTLACLCARTDESQCFTLLLFK